MSSSGIQARHAHGIALLQAGRLTDARDEFISSLERDRDDWSAWYWVGQCDRFDQRFESARENLETARRLAPREKGVLLALGIVLQLMARYEDAVSVLARAIEIDEDFVPAYNSLGVTLRHMGEFDKALHNYDAGTKALARAFVRTVPNHDSSPIVPYEDLPGTRWLDCAVFGAMFSVASSPTIEHIAFPRGEAAVDEMRSRRHGGLFWIDSSDPDGNRRVFLPNYFHTFREYLRASGTFHNLVGNQAEIHARRGASELARQLFLEATAFGDPRVAGFRIVES